LGPTGIDVALSWPGRTVSSRRPPDDAQVRASSDVPVWHLACTIPGYPMATHSALSVRAMAVVLAVSLAMSGCATKLRNVPTQALARQPVTIVERDHHDCEAAITGTLKGAWFPAEVEYASCLIARNYQVWVQVLDASVELRKASLKSKMPPARIMSDMVMCEQFVQDKVTVAEMVGRPVAFAASVFFWPAFLASFAASSTLFVYRERDYAACMGPRGYLVTPWRPAPGDQVAKRPFDDRMSP